MRTLFLTVMFAMFSLAACASATAQQLTFTAALTSGDGRVTPVLTWDAPGASECTASGGWSGTKAASGTETLPVIVTSQTYRLTCVWRGRTHVHLTWTPPTENTDGSPLTDLAGYRILYGRGQETLTEVRELNDPTAREYTVDSLEPGRWYFSVESVNSAGRRSDPSNVVWADTTADVTREESIAITVNPVPVAITDLRVIE